MKRTDEQVAIVDASRLGVSMGVKAFAGTGKTTTGVEVAHESPQRRFTYLSFNRRNANEARSRFPRNTQVKTAHGLAFAAVGKYYSHRITTSTFQLKAGLAERFERSYLAAGGSLTSMQLAFYAALEGLNAYFASDALTIDESHVPDGPYDTDLLVRLARGMWSAMKNRDDSTPITHDAYLKMWQTGTPRISADMILFDECQDASPAMLDIVLKSGIPTVFIGDPWQSIYGWRGAVDAFKRISNLLTLPLSGSWRFGPEIAELANSILGRLGEKQRVRGLGGPTAITRDEHATPDAVIARSTQGLIGAAVSAVEKKRSIHVVGGTEQIFEWLLAATDLLEFGHSRHRQFDMFKSFAELRDVAEMPIGAAFRPFVKVVDNYGGGTRKLVFDLERAQTDSSSADVILSSGHRFKGDDADVVQIESDFAPFATIERNDRTGRQYVEVDYQEANLAYVVLTRVRKLLDMSKYHNTLQISLDALDYAKRYAA
jgi:AAA domain